ncbi:MAG: hypothetical protein QN193_03435 [Armatimonadota bacterium]|nr:hypothetical protein [Armatimonadota bacterium]MDR7444367.1 hypothetical protein [Armatimonadota bacterium]MDR7569642.1 hypothetical protein [Armatimonadota bacterium]MDR7614854.1 hypothetical protein [Armatimonadota bacterium]
MNRSLLIGGGLGCGCLTLLAVVAVVAGLVVFARPKSVPTPQPTVSPPPAPSPAPTGLGPTPQPSPVPTPPPPGGRCPQQPVAQGPEALGKGICPQQVPGVEIGGGMTVRLGPDGMPTEPAGVFRVGERVGVDYTILRMDTQVVRVVVRVESQERVIPVNQPEPEDKPGRFLYRLDTGGGSPGLYAFALAVPQGGQPAVVLVIPFALQ